ncbi:hypothetical protein [uncultured Methylophaga sp.]|uniref:hypothetical protein n=1 Tax=uncultured Methylophaga sp. TaxID=285271 RepID=UPI0026218D21|nr:hypothetical protein [uncultured Methylophaga sp.]
MTHYNTAEMIDDLFTKTIGVNHVDIDIHTMKQLQDLADLIQLPLDQLPDGALIRVRTLTLVQILKRAIYLNSDEFLNQIAENWDNPVTISKRKLKH